MNIFLCELDRWMTDETALRQLLDKLNLTQHPNLTAPVHFSELPCRWFESLIKNDPRTGLVRNLCAERTHCGRGPRRRQLRRHRPPGPDHHPRVQDPGRPEARRQARLPIRHQGGHRNENFLCTFPIE